MVIGGAILGAVCVRALTGTVAVTAIGAASGGAVAMSGRRHSVISGMAMEIFATTGAGTMSVSLIKAGPVADEVQMPG
jgi:hypothetical protein